jgi:hypothetical protein
MPAKKKQAPRTVWSPNPGPQTLLFSCPAEIILFGGAKGGGKTDGMLVWAAQDIDKNDYRALIFRRTFPELEHHVIPRSQQLFSGIGRYDGKNHRWNFRTPDGGRSSIEFAYLERESDIFSYQGSQYAKIGFDESTLFSESTVRMMWTCVRTMVPNVRKQMLLTSNPVGPGFGWHKLMFIKNRLNRTIYRDALWPSDMRPVGATTCFIQSRVYDNYALLKNDPNYIDRLRSQSISVTKALLEGSWEETLHMALSVDPYVHTIQPFEIPEDAPRWMGLDWGVEDKAAAVWFTYVKGRVYAYRDHCRPGKLIIPYAQEVVDLSKGERIDYCCLSHECFSQKGTGNTQADQFIKVFSQAGIPIIKSDKDAEGRLMLMREYLRTVKVPTSEADIGIGGDYTYWMKRFEKEGIQAWNDYRKFGENDEAKLPKMQIFQPGVVNGKHYGCPDLISALPLLTTDMEKPKLLAEGQDDHSYDAAGYGMKAWVVSDETSLMEAYQKQLQGRVPDSLLAAHHALEAAKELIEEDDSGDVPIAWATPRYGDDERGEF